ncbi:hypothetical protein [Glutamicibacter sp. V16R2B1]|uniref:hypothetical protein n=1 Tax=Glutamicibacter sp. V16R2B1 TaxID=2036207 RepID=UPI0010FD2718|nr:hypothetical protein [Glutamicibacter sp. V16R2B1]MCK9901227.1 hypothetical protein [Frankia sp. Cpl3]TLK47795.1 hypothetical protein FDN03_15685 [Glutamicibacter sp. V16R2B1]
MRDLTAFSEHDQLELVRFDRLYSLRGFDRAARIDRPNFEDRILSANAATEDGLHRLMLDLSPALEVWWDEHIVDGEQLLAAHLKGRGGAA